jgi:hypothetical protein
LLTTNTIKIQRKDGDQESLWNESPSPGREAMIAIIDDESKLIRTLKAENEDEYDKLHFSQHPRRNRLLKYGIARSSNFKEIVSSKKIQLKIKNLNQKSRRRYSNFIS